MEWSTKSFLRERTSYMHGTFPTRDPGSSAISQFRLTHENTNERHPPAQRDVRRGRRWQWTQSRGNYKLIFAPISVRVQPSSLFWQRPDCCPKRQVGPSPPALASFPSADRCYQWALSQTGLKTLSGCSDNPANQTVSGAGTGEGRAAAIGSQRWGKQGWGFPKQHSLWLVVAKDENAPQGPDQLRDSPASSWLTLDCYQTPPSPAPCLMLVQLGGKLVPGAISLWTKHLSTDLFSPGRGGD